MGRAVEGAKEAVPLWGAGQTSSRVRRRGEAMTPVQHAKVADQSNPPESHPSAPPVPYCPCTQQNYNSTPQTRTAPNTFQHIMVSNPFSSHTSGGPGSEPSEPPPAYAQATGQQPAAGAHAGHQHTSSLEIPGNARRASSDYTASEEEHEEVIPANERAAADALTDERPIPKGWSREFDVK